MRIFTISLLVLVIALSSVAMADGLPEYLKVREKQRGDSQNTHVLYAGEGFSIVLDMEKAQALKNTRSQQNLYAARYLNTVAVVPQLKDYGKVLYMGNEDCEAILQIDDPQKADELAAFLHCHGGTKSCGSFIQLMTPQEVMLNASLPQINNASVDALVEKAINATTADTRIKEMGDLVEPDNIREFVEKLSAYHNRYHRATTGKQASDFIYQTFQTYAQKNSNVVVKQFNHSRNTPQPSVVVTFRGTTYPNEKVIMGSHLDSISGYGSGAMYNHAPGADDNASGTATVKEVLRIVSTHNYKFKRTVEFHCYAAEEAGLVGSGDIAASYKSKSEQVVGMIQIDMCIYGQGNAPIWLVTNDTSPQHTDLATKLIEQYTTTTWQKGQLFSGSSDHRSWHRRGYHAIFPFENPSSYNRSIHTNKDTIGNSGNFVLAGNMAKLAIAYISTIAELDQ